jgi:succinoglycan biosynthesis transport protein ExoP
LVCLAILCSQIGDGPGHGSVHARIMELKHFTGLFKRWAWFILLLTALSGVLAGLVSMAIPATYEAKATVVITGRSSVNELTPEIIQRLTGTYVELAQQPIVLNTVIDRIGLATTPRQLRRQISVALVPDSLLIEVKVRDGDPSRAATIANTLVAILQEGRISFLGMDPVLSRVALHVVEPAFPPDRPIFPWLLLNLVVGLGLGAISALIIVLVDDYFDDTLKAGEDLTRLTGLTHMATLVRFRKRADAAGVVATREPNSPVTEEFRLLRTHVEAASDQHLIRTLVVASGIRGEGKSTTAANLAVVLARSEKRVLLVDANLREPRLHQLFALSNQRGLTTALDQDRNVPIADHLQPTNVTNLSLLACGPIPDNPAEVLGSSAMLQLIEKLAAEADIVLFDTPALLDVTDATILARNCDAALLVVQAAKTGADALRAAHNRLEQFGIRTIGTVLNRAARYSYSTSANAYPQRRQYVAAEAVPAVTPHPDAGRQQHTQPDVTVSDMRSQA